MVYESRSIQKQSCYIGIGVWVVRLKSPDAVSFICADMDVCWEDIGFVVISWGSYIFFGVGVSPVILFLQ